MTTANATATATAPSAPPPRHLFSAAPCLKSQQKKEIASDLFFYFGFIAAVATVCALAGIAWGLLVKFSPKTVLMLQYLFQPTFDFLTR